jgi:hypothetical protein
MMAVKLKIQSLIALLLLATVSLQGCRLARVANTNPGLVSTTSGEIPTWTPRPEDLTLAALPTATRLAIDTPTATITPTQVAKTLFTPTPKTVSVAIKGGNLFVHRGPGLEYNFVGVLYDGDTTIATGRDLISRWIRVEFPSKPGVEGWITTETNYTRIYGDISNLPFIQTEPASPAFIRNCTKHEILILPAEVYLLSKFDAPDNEEQFDVGVYQVYDTDIPGNVRLEDVSLSEGRTVDIRYDGNGDKSKCE